MNTPFATDTKPIRLATDAQLGYLRSLMLDKAAHQGVEADDAHVMIDEWMATPRSLSEASENITRLKDEGYTGRKYTGIITDTDHRDSLEGFWTLPGGEIVKVQKAVAAGDGREYGKVLDTDTGKFRYTPGVISEVRKSGTRLALDQAKELGKLYGICVVCGRTLTDEDSIANGIGPICAQKF